MRRLSREVMRSRVTQRPARILIAGLFVAALLPAQKPAPPAGSTGGSTTVRSGSTPAGSIPSGQNPMPNIAARPLFFDGQVAFDDGTPMHRDVRIERVCSGTAYFETHPDSHGQFAFQSGATRPADPDASESGGAFGDGRSRAPAGSGTQQDVQLSLLGCQIRAVYPGYRSDVVEIPQSRDMTGVHLGTLILHRLTAVQGTTISVASAMAPKGAQKQYEKGLAAFHKGKLDEAEKCFASATEKYPHYASAWFGLGQAQQLQNRATQARSSYERAIQEDARFVSPYAELALLSGQEGRWEDAAEYSRKALDLNPVEFPSAYWYSAVSNFHLQRLAQAQRSAEALVKMDTGHQYPQAEGMLGSIYLLKGDPEQASAHMRAYLALKPDAEDAAKVRQTLEQINGSRAASAAQR